MKSIQQLISTLTTGEATAAHHALTLLLAESRESDAVFPHWDIFVALLSGKSGYQRIRGALLLIENAQWDKEDKTVAILPTLLALISDPKPIVARQCIKALPTLAAAKPELIPTIRTALCNATPGTYRGTMAPLVANDIANTLVILPSCPL